MTRHRSALAPALAALAAVITSAGAPAAEPDGDDPNEPPARPLRVRVELSGAVATFHLTELIDAEGPGSQDLPIDLPPRAVVTAGTVRTGKTTRPLALAAADDVGDRLADLQEREPGGTRASAVAIVQPELGPVMVTVMVPRHTQLVLELELEAPTCFDGDRRHVAIPEGWTEVLDAATRRLVVDNTDADGLRRDGAVDERCGGADAAWGGEVQTWLALPTTELSSQPAGDARIGARGGRFVHGADQAARIELAVSSTLADVPADLATAFVVDGSRSLGADVLDTERAVIASFLRHAPRSAVQVVTFDRAATALLPKWGRASAVAGRIDRALRGLVQRNGSDLDTGLAEAARWLARRHGTRRVVVFTDELFPERLAVLDPARLAKVLPAGTVVHVVAVESGGDALARDDDAALAPLATATEGMPVRASGAADALALVRPISLDHVRVVAPGFEPLPSRQVAGTMCVTPDVPTPIDLPEGTACTWWATGPSTRDVITVEGLVWGRRWQRVVPLGDRASVGVARELWSVLQPDTAPELLAAADLAARAVNSRWSLLATWGGDGGYADSALGGAMTSGCGCDDGSGQMGFGTTGRVHMTGPTLRHQVETAIAACRKAGDGATVELGLETTRNEIVGVTVAVGGVKGAAATALRGCVEAAVWDLALWVDSPPEHQRLSLRFDPIAVATAPQGVRSSSTGAP